MNEVKRHLVSRGCIVNDQTLPGPVQCCRSLQGFGAGCRLSEILMSTLLLCIRFNFVTLNT